MSKTRGADAEQKQAERGEMSSAEKHRVSIMRCEGEGRACSHAATGLTTSRSQALTVSPVSKIEKMPMSVALAIVEGAVTCWEGGPMMRAALSPIAGKGRGSCGRCFTMLRGGEAPMGKSGWSPLICAAWHQ